MGLGAPGTLWLGHSREALQGDSGVGHSRNTLKLGTPGTVWGWALQG